MRLDAGCGMGTGLTEAASASFSIQSLCLKEAYYTAKEAYYTAAASASFAIQSLCLNPVPESYA